MHTSDSNNGSKGPTRTTSEIERPVSGVSNSISFGSDVAAQALRDLDVPFIALNPGASFRGLHDSIVNYLGNTKPQMLLCLHEDAAVAIAHGYAKVADRPMAVAVHSNVGLLHASMGIFNAFCDRTPMIVLGATGPVDAAKRRPWIDWIHTSRDQGALVRNFTKWDDQPASPAAAREAILRAGWIANNTPKGPVYVNLDSEIQEMQLPAPLEPVEAARFVPHVKTGAEEDLFKELARLLRNAARPLILIGRSTRDQDAWNRRIRLVEAVGGKVMTSLLSPAAFPTDHPAHSTPPLGFIPTELIAGIREADLVLALDWIDLGGPMRAVKDTTIGKVIHVSMDHHVHNGWSMDYQALPMVDISIAAETDVVVSGILRHLDGPNKSPDQAEKMVYPPFQAAYGDAPLQMRDLVEELRTAVGTRKVSFTRLTISWEGHWWHFREPLDYLGADGGGGLGSGPGTAIGSALALKGTGRLPIAITGDGDFLMGATAIWTAAHYRIPILIVVANNRSFYNDEVHQERTALVRSRPTENKWIGQRISDPELDIAGIARSQGAVGIGPIKDAVALAAAYKDAIAAVEAGSTVVIDVWIEPGYGASTTSAMMGGAKPS